MFCETGSLSLSNLPKLRRCDLHGTQRSKEVTAMFKLFYRIVPILSRSFFRIQNRQKLPHCVSLPPGSKNVNSTKVLNCRAMFLYDKPYWMFWFDAPRADQTILEQNWCTNFLKLVHLKVSVMVIVLDYQVIIFILKMPKKLNRIFQIFQVFLLAYPTLLVNLKNMICLVMFYFQNMICQITLSHK